MFCKLYKVKYKGSPPDDTRFSEFEKFYEDNGVKVIGGWTDVDDENMLYFMTSYRDEGHYNEFVASMKENARYKELTDQMAGERESVEVTTLKTVGDIPQS